MLSTDSFRRLLKTRVVFRVLVHSYIRDITLYVLYKRVSEIYKGV